MSDLPTFDCPMCGEVTRGNTRRDEGSMLCRDCHHEFIYTTGDTLEEKLISSGYGLIRAQELATDMRALFAARGDQSALDVACEAIRLRDAMDCR